MQILLPGFDSRRGLVKEETDRDASIRLPDTTGDQRPVYSGKEKGFLEAIAWLIVGAVNHHLLLCTWEPLEGQPFDPEECHGCCPTCCGVCHSMAWLRDNDNDTITSLLKLIDGPWTWQLPDGSINWAAIEPHWHLTDCHAK